MSEHDFRDARFALVGRILQIGSRSANRESMDRVTGALDRFDLAPHERMADGRIEVAEIG